VSAVGATRSGALLVHGTAGNGDRRDRLAAHLMKGNLKQAGEKIKDVFKS
jgi:predicted metallopeptidase